MNKVSLMFIMIVLIGGVTLTVPSAFANTPGVGVTGSPGIIPGTDAAGFPVQITLTGETSAPHHSFTPIQVMTPGTTPPNLNTCPASASGPGKVFELFDHNNLVAGYHITLGGKLGPFPYGTAGTFLIPIVPGASQGTDPPFHVGTTHLVELVAGVPVANLPPTEVYHWHELGTVPTSAPTDTTSILTPGTPPQYDVTTCGFDAQATFTFYRGDQPFFISKPIPVGGEIVPVDMTALFIAGMSTNALWMLPSIGAAGVGIAIFKIKRKHI